MTLPPFELSVPVTLSSVSDTTGVGSSSSPLTIAALPGSVICFVPFVVTQPPSSICSFAKPSVARIPHVPETAGIVPWPEL